MMDINVLIEQRFTNVSMCFLLALSLTVSWTVHAEVPVDRMPDSLSLPASYPDSWVFVYTVPQKDNEILGAYAIVDVAAATKEIKGQFQGAYWSSLIVPTAGPEFFVAESFLERVGHGARTDVITITDKSHLTPVAEIALPGAKRGIMAGNLMDVSHDGEFMLLFNFTPAASVSVVDLRKRKLVSEVPVPGCTSVYPSGKRGFSSLCGDGTLVTIALGENGQVLHESRSTAFNDIDNDVLFVEPAMTGSTSYFVTAKGTVRALDTANETVKIQPAWPLITAEEVTDGWRTSGGRLVAVDGNGRLYVRVYRETGYDEQLKDNTEVWVFDTTSTKRLGRIPLKNGGGSIEVTRGRNPYLVAVAESDASAGESLDVYDASTGVYLRTIGGWWPGTSLNLIQARR